MTDSVHPIPPQSPSPPLTGGHRSCRGGAGGTAASDDTCLRHRRQLCLRYRTVVINGRLQRFLPALSLASHHHDYCTIGSGVVCRVVCALAPKEHGCGEECDQLVFLWRCDIGRKCKPHRAPGTLFLMVTKSQSLGKMTLCTPYLHSLMEDSK